MRAWATGILADPDALGWLIAVGEGRLIAAGEGRLPPSGEDRQPPGPEFLPPIARAWLEDRRHPVPVAADVPPGLGWMPASIRTEGPDACLTWVYAGGVRPTEPFFESALRIARRRLVNRLIAPETPLSMLPGQIPGRMPDGFVFHLSRSGSTLVSQVVAHLPDSLAISESPAFDAALRIAGNTADAESIGMLRAVMAAHDDDGPIAPGRFVVKLDSWHLPFLPVLTKAFPTTPWVVLTRDPVEILVSHRRRPGIQMVPGMLQGVPGFGEMPPRPAPDHLAAILGALCAATVRHRSLGRGIVIDYAAFPHAIEAWILPHFGIVTDAAERRCIAKTLARDAKTPALSFIPDRLGKQEEADAALRAAAARWCAASYHRLHDA